MQQVLQYVTTMELSDLHTYQVAVLQSRGNRAFKSKMSQFLRNHDITMMQWSIIGLVSDSKDSGIRISDLATELDTSMAFITTTVNMLEAKGIVQKAGHERDSRAKLVRLSANFVPKVKAIEAELHTQVAQWLQAKVEAKDLADYLRVLTTIAKA